MSIETEVKKGGLFVKQVLAKLKGDDNEALANKIARKSISAIDGQVAALKSKIVDDENQVEEAEERLATAVYPTSVFSDNKSYVQRIVSAQESVDAAQANLDATKASITFFEALLTSF